MIYNDTIKIYKFYVHNRMANATPRKLHNVRLHCTLSNFNTQSQFNLHIRLNQMCESEENGKTFS